MIDKEVRALLPAWIACALAILASRSRIEPFMYLGVPAYFVGTTGLGAWVMGHEYAHGTLASMLALPVARRRIWIAKLAVAAPMLAGLSLLGTFSTQLESGDRIFGSALFALPPIIALFVAPWLTMLTRSPLAAAVFTFSALGGSLALGEWVGEWWYGFTAHVDAFRVAFMWWALGGLSIVGAVMGWRTFAGLEAMDGRSADLQLPFVRRRTTASVTRRPAMLRLVAKELRLQQLALVIAALWTIGSTITALSGVGSTPSKTFEFSFAVLTIMTAFYSLVLPAVVGSLACAEERHFGTLDAQLLLPVRCSTQWIVKSITALALAVTLAVLLPAALGAVLGGATTTLVLGRANRLTVTSIVVTLGITGVSLYVSTLARSGLRALIGTIAAVLGFAALARLALDLELGRKAYALIHATRAAHAHPHFMILSDAYRTAPLGAAVALLLALALPHFRYAARQRSLVAVHVAILLACVLAYDVAINVMMALSF